MTGRERGRTVGSSGREDLGAEGMAVSGLRRRAGFIAILLASASVLAGCGVATAGGGTKAGGESLPVTLHLGTAESGEPPYRLFVEQFARDVFDRSDGGIRIIVDWESIPWTPSSEGQLADAVAAGDIDLALIPDRVFPRYGPSALDALHTPFLIDSMALADAVASGEIGAAMLADLPLKGTVGLALAPEELRHPAGYQRALTSAEDFVGLRIRAADVDTQLSTLLTSLGALPRTVVSTRDAAQDGVIDAAETGYPLYRDMPIGMTYTANVTFFPKVNVLLASSGRFESLSAAQQEILRTAAGAARDSAAAQRPTELDGLTEVCTWGLDGALAPAAQLAALVRRAAPVTAALRRNERAAETMDAIAAAKAAIPPTPVVLPEICGPATGDSARPGGG